MAGMTNLGPLGMLEVRWGLSVEHLVCTPKIKGWRTQLKIKPTPCKNSQKTNTESKGHNPRVDLCPLIEQKMKKMGDFRRIGYRVGWGQNGNFGVMGGRRWVGMVETDRRWCSGGGGGGGWWWVVVFWRMRDGGRVWEKGKFREVEGVG
jgi:hypothetical protein